MSLLEAIYIKETFSAEKILRKLIYVSPVSLCQGTGYLIFSFTLLHFTPQVKLSYGQVSSPFISRLQE